MPIVEELNVSLKDFLPQGVGRKVLAEPGGVQYVIGDRLFAELETYARRNRIPLSAALRQLRDEIHKAT